MIDAIYDFYSSCFIIAFERWSIIWNKKSLALLSFYNSILNNSYNDIAVWGENYSASFRIYVMNLRMIELTLSVTVKTVENGVIASNKCITALKWD